MVVKQFIRGLNLFLVYFIFFTFNSLKRVALQHVDFQGALR